MSKETKIDDTSREQYINSSISWMYDMELIENRHVQDDLYINLYKISKRIKDLELFIDKPKRSIFIYVKLSFFGRLFKSTKKNIITSMIDVIQFRLPRFSVRITTNRQILEKATKMFEDISNKPIETGGTNEKDTTTNNDSNVVESDSEDKLRSTPDLLPDKEQ